METQIYTSEDLKQKPVIAQQIAEVFVKSHKEIDHLLDQDEVDFVYETLEDINLYTSHRSLYEYKRDCDARLFAVISDWRKLVWATRSDKRIESNKVIDFNIIYTWVIPWAQNKWYWSILKKCIENYSTKEAEKNSDRRVQIETQINPWNYRSIAFNTKAWHQCIDKSNYNLHIYHKIIQQWDRVSRSRSLGVR